MTSTALRRILIIDDDAAAAAVVADRAASSGFEATVIDQWDQALNALERASGTATSFDVVIVTVCGVEAARRVGAILRRGPTSGVIVLTSFGSVQEAVAVLQAGGVDYLVRPVREDHFVDAMERAVASRLLHQECEVVRSATTLIGDDAFFQETVEIARRAAATSATILIEGESGTGKSLLAREIHDWSERSQGPFVEMACGSVSESLLESELFGHVKGAFTGATADAIGRFQAADGGTLFLDEINSASEAMQVKLLRVLQEGRFEPVGTTRSSNVDVRIVAATNESLEALVQEGRFRRDLYYRLHVVAVPLPPLRERSLDVPELATRFLEAFAASTGRKVHGLTPEAMTALQGQSFPGNVRELRNIVERGVVLATRPLISVDDLGLAAPRAGAIGTDNRAASGTLKSMQAASEREAIRVALRANAWHRTATAAALGINRATLYKKMVMHDLHATRRAG